MASPLEQQLTEEIARETELKSNLKDRSEKMKALIEAKTKKINALKTELKAVSNINKTKDKQPKEGEPKKGKGLFKTFKNKFKRNKEGKDGSTDQQTNENIVQKQEANDKTASKDENVQYGKFKKIKGTGNIGGFINRLKERSKSKSPKKKNSTDESSKSKPNKKEVAQFPAWKIKAYKEIREWEIARAKERIAKERKIEKQINKEREKRLNRVNTTKNTTTAKRPSQNNTFQKVAKTVQEGQRTPVVLKDIKRPEEKSQEDKETARN